MSTPPVSASEIDAQLRQYQREHQAAYGDILLKQAGEQQYVRQSHPVNQGEILNAFVLRCYTHVHVSLLHALFTVSSFNAQPNDFDRDARTESGRAAQTDVNVLLRCNSFNQFSCVDKMLELHFRSARRSVQHCPVAKRHAPTSTSSMNKRRRKRINGCETISTMA